MDNLPGFIALSAILLALVVLWRRILDRQIPSNLRNDMADVLASYTIFPAGEIRSAYERCRSWDKVLGAMEKAQADDLSLADALEEILRS